MLAPSRNPTASFLNCEQLEPRENPAGGNVTAFVSGGQLFVIGDAADNAVSTQIDGSGNLVVIGVSGTTVNGQPSVNFGFFRPIHAFFQGNNGNDQIDVAGIPINGQLNISGGNGNDLITLRGTSSNTVTFFAGAGDDTLITTSVFARTGADFHGEAGFDIWKFNSVFVGSFLTQDGFDRIDR